MEHQCILPDSETATKVCKLYHYVMYILQNQTWSTIMYIGSKLQHSCVHLHKQENLCTSTWRHFSPWRTCRKFILKAINHHGPSSYVSDPCSVWLGKTSTPYCNVCVQYNVNMWHMTCSQCTSDLYFIKITLASSHREHASCSFWSCLTCHALNSMRKWWLSKNAIKMTLIICKLSLGKD